MHRALLGQVLDVEAGANGLRGDHPTVRLGLWMAATAEVEQLRGGRCPECGSGFARDLAGRGYRRHLEKLPKRRSDGTILTDAHGDPVMCGGTKESWHKGRRD